jgi:hypothetical protein
MLLIYLSQNNISYAEPLILIEPIDCDVYITDDGDFVEMDDIRAKFCGRTARSEDRILTLAIYEAECQRSRFLNIERLKITEEMLLDTQALLSESEAVIDTTVDYGDDMERLMKAERLKWGLLGGGAGVIIGIILSAVLMVAL